MAILLVTNIKYVHQEARQLVITLNDGSEITAEACHESWEQWGATVDQLCFTQPIVGAHNDWLHGGELPFTRAE